jgi:photosystem II stability/assembly factor-like uncharacterized protein
MTPMTDPNPEQAPQYDVVYALAGSANALYAARTSGLYLSQDEGTTWQDAFASLNIAQPLTATAVALDGNTDGETVFVGVNGAVLRSDDDGGSWQIAHLASPPPQVTALAISPAYNEDGVVAAGTAEDGVFVSTDRGINWIPWNFGLIDPNVYSLAISPDFANDHTLYAGTESGLFRSRNGGRGWHEVPFPMDAAPVLSLALSPQYASDGLLYAGTEKNGLFVSDDFGLNWQHINSELISTAVSAMHIRSAAHSIPMIWLLLEDKLVCSSDGGHSWKQHRGQIPPGKLAMTMLPLPASPDKVLVGFADGDILLLG